MARDNIILTNFTAGEVSPLLAARVDLAKYSNGCAVLENMVVLPHGGVTRSPGTIYAGSVKTPSKKAVLIPFRYSFDQAYILEVGEGYIRFWHDHGFIEDPGVPGSPYEVATTYTEAHLQDLQFRQSADVMYITHNLYPVKKLTRLAENNWTITTVHCAQKDKKVITNITTGAAEETLTLDVPPAGAGWVVGDTITGTLSTETCRITAVLSSTSYTIVDRTGAFTLGEELSNGVDAATQGAAHPTVSAPSTPGIVTSSAHGFVLGEVVYIAGVVGMTEVNGKYFTVAAPTTDTFSLGVDTSGYTPYVSGGLVEKAISNITRANPGIVTCTSHGLNTGDRILIEGVTGMVELNGEYQTVGVVTTNTYAIEDTSAMTAYTSGGRHSKVLFSQAGDYPATVSFFEERLAFAATTDEPQKMWFSVTGDYENFLEGENADDAMVYTIKSTAQVRWLFEHAALVVGTSEGVWKAGGAGGDPLVTTNVLVRKQVNTPCSDLPPLQVGESILFVQMFGTKLRELVHDYKKDNYSGGYSDSDLTILSEHITRATTTADSGIVDMALTVDPIPVVWMILTGGDLIGLTFMKEQEVVGFHRHPRENAIFESIAVIPGDTEDELWAVVRRTIDGATVRYVEYFSTLDIGGLEDPHFVDCGLAWDGGAAKVMTGATQANPVVVTSASHGLSNGNRVRVQDVVGMEELNDRVFIVAGAGAHTFQLKDLSSSSDIDGTAFTAYTSGGTITKVANTFSGLDHLEGEEVAVYAGGEDYGTETVSAGAITLSSYYNYVDVGLPITYLMKPVRPEMGHVTKTSQGQLKKIDKIVLRLYKSMAGEVGGTEDTLDPIPYVDRTTPFTGDVMMGFWAEEGRDANIVVKGENPLPFTLLAIIANGETFEGD